MPQRFNIVAPDGKVISHLNAPDDAPPEEIQAVYTQVARDHEKGVPFSKTAAAVRAFGGIGGMFGPVPGAVSSFGSEVLAEGIEGRYSIPQIGVQTALGAIPGPKQGKSLVVDALKQVVHGTALAGGGELATEVAEGQPVNWENVGNAAMIGFGLSTPLAARTAQLRRRVAAMKLAREGAVPALVRDPGTGDLVAPEEAGTAVATLGTPEPAGGAARERPGIGSEPWLGPEPEVGATPSAIMEPRVRPEHTEAMVAKAREDLVATARALADTDASKEGKRFFHQLAESFSVGDTSSREVLDLLEKEGMSIPQFLNHWKDTISVAGTQLGKLGRLKRELNLLARKNPKLLEALDAAGEVVDPFTGKITKFREDPGFWEMAYSKLKGFDDFTRASVVVQTGTTFRNIESNLGRYSLDAFEASLQKSMLGEPVGDAAGEMLNYLGSAARAMNPNQVKRFAKILDKYTPELNARLRQKMPATSVLEAHPIEAAKLLQLPAGEVTLGTRYTRLINTLNVFGESYGRRAAFDVKLRQLIREGGENVDDMIANPGQIPKKWIEEATHHALELTWAAPPTGPIGQQFMKAWVTLRPFGLASSMAVPFPRLMANAYKFLTDFSPAATFRLFGYNAEKLMENPKEYARVAARMQLGTIMLGTALVMRNSEALRGPKWYYTRLYPGGSFHDVRSMSPFSTYLFYAEAIRQKAETGHIDMTMGDMVQGLASINRIAGTGLVALDMFRGVTPDKLGPMLEDSVGQWLGRITVPLRTPKDILAHFSDEEATARSTREPVRIAGMNVPMIAPAISNVPWLSRILPPMSSPMRPEPKRTLNPLARQLGGLSEVDFNPVEWAAAELGLEYGDVAPKTGIRPFDRMATDIMGKIAGGDVPIKIAGGSMTGKQLVESPQFKAAPRLSQKLLLKEFLSQARKLATAAALKQNPQFAGQLWARRQKPEVREMLQEMPGTARLFESSAVGQ